MKPSGPTRTQPGHAASARRLFRLLHAVLLTGLFSGCIPFVMPVPTAYHPGDSRRNLTDASGSGFVPGTTKLAEVVLTLGEPDTAAPDGSSLTYTSERVRMHLVWGWMVPYLGGEAWDRTYSKELFLQFEFDQDQILRGLSQTNISFRITDRP